MPRPETKRRDPTVARLVLFLGLSLLLHGIGVVVIAPLWPALTASQPHKKQKPVTVFVEKSSRGRPKTPEERQKEEELAKKEEEEEENRLEDKQIVEVAPPNQEKTPEDYDYLSEHDITVDEETRTEQFRIDAKVLAKKFSHDDAMQFEDLLDLGFQDPSTGAKAGSERFDPSRDGSMASVPSPFKLSNKDGLDSPVPSSHREQNLSGSPSNDLTRARLGDEVNLNTKEVLYAGYINRIKRLVSFYWNQNLDNLPPTVRLQKPRYQTVVYVVLDGAGALESVEVTGESGVAPLDDAVVRAFRVSGPFPNPPEQLIAKDGRVYLDDMGFVVQVGGGRATFVGVDPRSGVQFPGILKATH